MPKESQQAPADKAPPEMKPQSGKASSQGNASATEPSEEAAVVPVSASEGPDPHRKELQDNFKEAHALITKCILGQDPGEQELNIVKAFRVSQAVLDQYVTLDWQHYEDIDRLMKAIREYASDRSRKRPLNIVMQAEPGSGKSHFIRCLAQRMSKDGLSDITFNMASLQSLDDFIQPLEAVRNLKVVDKLPLLFLDEFDSDAGNYAPLLPLLWDGELNVGHRELRIGKVVIVLAGSGAQIEEAMKSAKGMQHAAVSGEGKLTDSLVTSQRRRTEDTWA